MLCKRWLWVLTKWWTVGVMRNWAAISRVVFKQISKNGKSYIPLHGQLCLIDDDAVNGLTIVLMKTRAWFSAQWLNTSWWDVHTMDK